MQDNYINDYMVRLEGKIKTIQEGELYTIRIIDTDRVITLSNENEIEIYLQALCNAYDL